MTTINTYIIETTRGTITAKGDKFVRSEGCHAGESSRREVQKAGGVVASITPDDFIRAWITDSR